MPLPVELQGLDQGVCIPIIQVTETRREPRIMSDRLEGLKLDGINTGFGGGIDVFESEIEALVVVAANFGNDKTRLPVTETTLTDIQDDVGLGFVVPLTRRPREQSSPTWRMQSVRCVRIPRRKENRPAPYYHLVVPRLFQHKLRCRHVPITHRHVLDEEIGVPLGNTADLEADAAAFQITGDVPIMDEIGGDTTRGRIIVRKNPFRLRTVPPILSRLPFLVAPPPDSARKVSSDTGAYTPASAGRWSRTKAAWVTKPGKPSTKLAVPSRGSINQYRSGRSPVRPCESSSLSTGTPGDNADNARTRKWWASMSTLALTTAPSRR